eukprot:4889006-Pyramimonas_sp.AAC.1
MSRSHWQGRATARLAPTASQRLWKRLGEMAVTVLLRGRSRPRCATGPRRHAGRRCARGRELGDPRLQLGHLLLHPE